MRKARGKKKKKSGKEKIKEKKEEKDDGEEEEMNEKMEKKGKEKSPVLNKDEKKMHESGAHGSGCVGRLVGPSVG